MLRGLRSVSYLEYRLFLGSLPVDHVKLCLHWRQPRSGKDHKKLRGAFSNEMWTLFGRSSKGNQNESHQEGPPPCIAKADFLAFQGNILHTPTYQKNPRGCKLVVVNFAASSPKKQANQSPPTSSPRLDRVLCPACTVQKLMCITTHSSVPSQPVPTCSAQRRSIIP